MVLRGLIPLRVWGCYFVFLWAQLDNDCNDLYLINVLFSLSPLEVYLSTETTYEDSDFVDHSPNIHWVLQEHLF